MVDENNILSISSRRLLGTAKVVYGLAVVFLGFALVMSTGVIPVQALNTAAAGSRREVSGNPSCTSLGYQFGTKLDRNPTGNVTISYQGHTFKVFDVEVEEGEGKEFDWEASRKINAVIVKGGPSAYIYQYSPQASQASDLVAPDGKGVSHIEFCWYPSTPTPTTGLPTSTSTIVPPTSTSTIVPPTSTPTTMPPISTFTPDPTATPDPPPLSVGHCWNVNDNGEMVFNFKAVNRGEKGAFFQIENTWSEEIVNFGFLDPGAAARGQGNTQGTWLKYFRWDEAGEWVQFGGTHSTRFAERNRDPGDDDYVFQCLQPEPTETTQTPDPTTTTVTPDPTGTPVPTETTETLEPTETTETPAPTEPTDPTDSPEPTDTPEETDTPAPTDTPEPTNTSTPVPTVGIPITGGEIEGDGGTEILIPVTGPETSIWKADPAVKQEFLTRLTVNSGLVFFGIGLIVHGLAIWRGKEE